MRSATVLAFCLALAACGGVSDPGTTTLEGYAALSGGDDATAAELFASALDAMDPSHPSYERARLGLVEANVERHPSVAAEEFLALAAESDSIDASEYARIGRLLADAGASIEAGSVVNAGIEAYPDEASLAAVHAIVQARAKEVNDPAQRAALESLGYL